VWGVASVLTRRGEWHESEGGYCEGAWGASESIGRFALIVFATPMALVIRMRIRYRSLGPLEPVSIFFAFLHCIHHTRPDPITKRISAVPPSKWRDVSYICLPIDLLELSS